MQPEGARVWRIPDAYLGSANMGGQPCSHEAVCVLNTGGRPANLALTFYFADCEPVGPIRITVGAGRCDHIRTDQPARFGGYAIPRDTPYGIRLESDVPVAVQYSPAGRHPAELRVDDGDPVSPAVTEVIAYIGSAGATAALNFLREGRRIVLLKAPAAAGMLGLIEGLPDAISSIGIGRGDLISLYRRGSQPRNSFLGGDCFHPRSSSKCLGRNCL